MPEPNRLYIYKVAHFTGVNLQNLQLTAQKDQLSLMDYIIY